MADINKTVQYTLEVTGANEAATELQKVGDASGQTSSSTNDLSGALSGLTGQFALGGIAAGVAMEALSALKQIVQQLASDSLELTVEMADLTDAMGYIYGDAAPSLIESLDSISESSGYTRSEIYGITRDLGAMLATVGLTSTQVASMSANIVDRSADAAAALGLDLSQAANAMEAAMSGSSRAARTLGIDISESAVQAELLSMGISETASNVDAATLAQARYNIVMEATSRYQGAAAEEMNTLEGAQRQLTASYEEMATQIGDAAAPTLQQFLEIANNLLPIVGDILTQIVELVGTGVGPLATQLEVVTGILSLVWDGLQALEDIVIEQIPFLSDLQGIWSDLTFSWSDADTWIRNLIGLQDEEIIILGEQTSALDTLYNKQGTYNEKIANASINELLYVQALLARMNVLGLMDPAMEAAQARINELQAQTDALLASAEAKRQEGKDSGLATSSSGGEGALSSEEIKAQRSIAYAKELVNINRDRLRAQEEAAEAIKEEYHSIREEEMAAWEEEMERISEYRKEQKEMQMENAEENASQIVDTFEGIFNNMHDLDDYVMDMIKQWAAQLLKAFAVQTLTDAFTGGLGGKLLGASGGGKFLK